RHLRLNRRVALKMIRSAELAMPEQLVRFCSEGETVARLRHPHIVQIYEVGTHNQQPYLALELMEGGSLAEAQGSKPLPARLAAGIVETLARAMDYTHAQGIVHRDLTPANILLESPVRGPKPVPEPGLAASTDYGPRTTDYGLLKISDFGLAKHLFTDSR